MPLTLYSPVDITLEYCVLQSRKIYVYQYKINQVLNEVSKQISRFQSIGNQGLKILHGNCKYTEHVLLYFTVICLPYILGHVQRRPTLTAFSLDIICGGMFYLGRH